MEPQPPEPTSYFGRILLINLGLVVVLHIGRQLIEPNSGIYGALFMLVLFNLFFALLLVTNGRGRMAGACLLAGLLIAMAGFSDCVSHFHLDTR